MSGYVATIGAKISETLAWGWSLTTEGLLQLKTGSLFVKDAMHGFIAGPLAATVSKVTATAGPIVGPTITVAAIGLTSYAANRLWYYNNKSPEAYKAANIALNALGFSLAIGVGAATTAAVGTALGGISLGAYAAGSVVSAATLLVNFDPKKAGHASTVKKSDALQGNA